MVVRMLSVVAGLALCLLAAPAAAPAATNVDVTIGSPGDRLVLKGPVLLAPGQRASTIIVVDGPVSVPRGALVTGDVIAVDGPVRIAGEVRGRVVAIGGLAVIERTARIGDGVRWVEDEPVVAPGAQVDGGVKRVQAHLGWSVPFVSALLWWLAVGVSTLVLALLLVALAPRAADATFGRMRDGGWGPALGVGFAIAVLLPVAAIVAIVTLVGIPLGLAVLLSLVPLALLGYAACCWVLGRALVREPGSRWLALLAGWAALRVLALIPAFGVLVFALAAMFGLGALTWTLLGARRAPPAMRGPEVPGTAVI